MQEAYVYKPTICHLDLQPRCMSAMLMGAHMEEQQRRHVCTITTVTFPIL